VFLVIKDKDNTVVRRIQVPAKKGIHRVAWDLRYPHTDAVRSTNQPKDPKKAPKGLMAAPGEYTATLVKMEEGKVTELAPAKSFNVKRMKKGALDGATPDVTAAFWRELEDINIDLSATSTVLREQRDKVILMTIALSKSRSAPGDLDAQLHKLNTKLELMNKQFSGDPLRSAVGEKSLPTIGQRVNVAAMGTRTSTYGPTPTHRQSLAIARKQLDALKTELAEIIENDIPQLEKALIEAKAPYVKGSGLR
jgi:hypothetical protein